MRQDEADLAVKVYRAAGKRNGVDRRRQPKRNSYHDNHGADEAFKLRGKHKKNDQPGEGKDNQASRRLESCSTFASPSKRD